ncbi:DUF92 domain-containing protein [Bacillus sp. NEB1478]|uniref:DUF92 domain-containing protein n=1 Tax=Bacillus sp. NEB1478 TaxID=3073816 RepID=UPI002872FA0B|nr:DUF92 domain-containing protein [Bacillus sp. NEB1478]WNB93539.1 DUF92 domain-containing protein [Bacillus sp. NEB1478]
MDSFFIAGIVLICILSVYYGFLTLKGSITAFFTGLFIYISFGWEGLIILGTFFLTSSLLTKWKKEKKRDKRASEEERKGRTSGQVLANGGVALMAAIFHLFFENSFWLVVFVCSFAAAMSDTWASEIGILSKRQPFHIKKWRKVENGLSGAVSWLGTIASIAGAAIIGICFYFLYPIASFAIVILIMFAGFMGNLTDTFLGAWFEQSFYCSVCKTQTEAAFHCETKTLKVFGYSWFTNNVVNFLSTLIGGCIGGGIYLCLNS